jgi:hypothetical protein
LTALKVFSEAEGLLLSGYDGIIKRQATLTASERPSLREAGERIVRLYENSGQQAKARDWRERLGTQSH